MQSTEIIHYFWIEIWLQGGLFSSSTVHRLSLPPQTVSLLLVSQEANLSMTNGQTGRGGEAAPAYKIRLQPNSDPGTKI